MSNTNKKYTKVNPGMSQELVGKKKTKKPFYKRWWFILLAVIFVLGAIGNLGDSGDESTGEELETSQSANESVKEENMDSETISKEDEPKEAIVTTADELFQALDDNALKAAKTYEDQYVEITGILSNIDAQGDYISLGAIYPGFTFSTVYCGISDEHLDAVMEMVEGQEVTVVGTMNGVGEVLGYRLKVERILEGPSKPLVRESESTETDVEEPTDDAEKVENQETEVTETEESTNDESSGATIAEKNAIKTAENYLDFTAFSREGLIDQLEFEGFTTDEATYGADNCNADWMQQAILSAKNYLDFSAFSESGLIDQLEFEGFTTEEAVYGATNCNADWMEQAVKSAENYLEFSSFSRAGLIEQLEFEGFTTEQATYGVEQNGF